MAEHKEPIFWKDELVGYIENPKKWPVLWRGKWVSADTRAAQEFLNTLRRGIYLWIEFGEQNPKDVATVEKAPGDEIEFILTEGFDEQKTLPLDLSEFDDYVQAGPARQGP